MKRWEILASVLMAATALALLVVFGVDALGQGRHAGDESGVLAQDRAGLQANDVVTNAFSYQGVLKEGGQPVTGDRQMIFRLYEDDDCTTSVGDSVTRTVSVSDGLFDVSLSFAHETFDGRALWLETEVDGTIIGCQRIQNVPYANSVRPGAVISGPVSSDAQLLHVRSGSETADEGVVGAKIGRRSSLGYPVGLYGYGYDYGSVGVWGASDSPFGWGVNGIADGSNSIGVRGIANAFTSTTHGVYGEAASSDGYGGYFANTATAENGWALAAEGRHGAIITATSGSALVATGSGDSAVGDDGVRGGHTGDGVVGFSSGGGNLDNGVVGFTNGGYGVYGFSNATGQYGGYFDDPILVNGGCTGCTMSYVARNTSDRSLQVGDLVRTDGVEASAAGGEQPVMQVALAGSGDRVLGVVRGRTAVTMVEPGTDDAKPGPHYGPIGGDATPGDYLIVVVQGMAQVRLDPAAQVSTGDGITAGLDGAIEAADASSVGMVLDEPDGDGLAWVLVGFD